MEKPQAKKWDSSDGKTGALLKKYKGSWVQISVREGFSLIDKNNFLRWIPDWIGTTMLYMYTLEHFIKWQHVQSNSLFVTIDWNIECSWWSKRCPALVGSTFQKLLCVKNYQWRLLLILLFFSAKKIVCGANFFLLKTSFTMLCFG